MEKLFIWLFVLMTVLLIPACMLGLGWRFVNKPPKSINGGYGYRSARSMKSQAAWDFAQAYSGRFWLRAGRPALAVSAVWMALLLGREVDVVGRSAIVLTVIQMVPFLMVIPATERALKREFDDYGRKR